MACCGEGAVARGVGGNAACAVAGGPEDAGGELYQAVRQADLQEGVGCFQEEHRGGNLEVHPTGYLARKEIQNTALIFTQLSRKVQNVNF